MMTTQKQVRAAFWQWVREFRPAGVTPRRITNYSGNGKMHNTDTRCAFVDWLDAECKAGNIGDAVAQRVTL